MATNSIIPHYLCGSLPAITASQPEPQRGICEAYRVIKEGGVACIIGPVHPTAFPSRYFAYLALDVCQLPEMKCIQLNVMLGPCALLSRVT